MEYALVFPRSRIKFIAIVMSFVALFQNSVFAVAREVNLLPEMGYFRGCSTPQKSCASVVHIQDIHMNLEAQKNIAAAVSKFSKDQADLIAIEGAFGPLDFKRFSTYPFPESVRSVADAMLNALLIPGPVYMALTDKTLPPVVGIDDEKLYHRNVDAYKRAASFIPENSRAIDRLTASLTAKKRRVFNHELYLFDAVVRRYRANEIAFIDFVAEVRGRLSDEDVAKFPHLAKLCRAAGFESVLDLNAIREAPSMAPYLRYFSMMNEIDGKIFYAELASAEQFVFGKLALTGEEKTVVAASRRLGLLGKLVRFELSPSEWNEYRSGRTPVEKTYLRNLADFEEFYASAEARDDAMASNLLDAMAERNAKKAVLVTGGFHSPGISRRLETAHVRHDTFVPRVTKIQGLRGSEYLSVFKRKKSPLEYIFPTLRLSVPTEGWNETLMTQAAAGVIAAESKTGRKRLAAGWFRGRYGSGFLLMVLGIVMVLPGCNFFDGVDQVKPGTAAKYSYGGPVYLGIALLAVSLLSFLKFLSFSGSSEQNNLFPDRFVSGLYWEPTLKIKGENFDASDVPAQLREKQRQVDRNGLSPKEYALNLLSAAEEQSIPLELFTPLRGFDGPGSALDLLDYQQMLKPRSKKLAAMPSTITIATSHRVHIRIERMTEDDRIRPEDERPVEIEYKSVTMPERSRFFYSEGAEVVTKENKERNRGKNLGMAVNGYADMAGYIFVDLFGLGGGIRIVDETDVPGGMESSSITIKTLVEAASLLSGIRLSKADIWWLSTCLENGVFGGVTGGQGPISSDLGGVYQNFWFLTKGTGNGHNFNGASPSRRVFSTELVPASEWEKIEEHMILAQAGVERGRRKLPDIKRPGPLINKMWLGLLSNQDEVAWPMFEEMVPLASEYAYALKVGDYATVVRTVNRLVEIRDLLLGRWMNLMLDARAGKRFQSNTWWWQWRRVPTYAEEFATNAKNLENTDYRAIHQLLVFSLTRKKLIQTSLYTLYPINEFLEDARKWGLGAMPAGAGGLGSMIGVISKTGKQELHNFTHVHDLPPVTEVDDMTQRHHMSFTISGPMEIVGFQDVGVPLPAGPERRYYDQIEGDIITEDMMERRKQDEASTPSGGRWPFLVSFYDGVGKLLADRGDVLTGLFISRVALPLLIESGLFVIGGSALTALLLNVKIGFTSEFITIFIIFKMLWLILDMAGSSHQKNLDRFWIVVFTITMAPVSGFIWAALLPHFSFNTARMPLARPKQALSLFQSHTDPVMIIPKMARRIIAAPRRDFIRAHRSTRQNA